ncbi:unnamed protein product, partial [Trichogramma brassicae]
MEADECSAERAKPPCRVTVRLLLQRQRDQKNSRSIQASPIFTLCTHAKVGRDDRKSEIHEDGCVQCRQRRSSCAAMWDSAGVRSRDEESRSLASPANTTTCTT